MNFLFALFFLLSALLFLLHDPSGFLPALLSGAEKAASLSLALLSSYCVWLGFFAVLEKSGISAGMAKIFYPFARKLFRSENKEAIALACGNLSANMLGLPGAPTPLGIKANEKFLSDGNGFASDMLFLLNATSLQLLPATVVALRASLGSASPADIVAPTLVCTLFSTAVGVGTFLLCDKIRAHGRRKGMQSAKSPDHGRKTAQSEDRTGDERKTSDHERKTHDHGRGKAWLI